MSIVHISNDFDINSNQSAYLQILHDIDCKFILKDNKFKNPKRFFFCKK